MANERHAANMVASFRSDAFLDFHIYVCYYCCFDNNKIPIITRLRSVSRLRSDASSDDFSSRYCSSDDRRFLVDDKPVAGLLLVAVFFIAVMIVRKKRTRTLSSIVRFSICNIKVERMKEISVHRNKDKIQAIYNNNRWWNAFSLDQLIYNQQQQQEQLDVVFVQCNQHHRESHHRDSTRIENFYKTIAFDNNQLLSVVDFHFNVGNIRFVQNKKILVENIIFAYLISLDLYS